MRSPALDQSRTEGLSGSCSASPPASCARSRRPPVRPDTPVRRPLAVRAPRDLGARRNLRRQSARRPARLRVRARQGVHALREGVLARATLGSRPVRRPTRPAVGRRDPPEPRPVVRRRGLRRCARSVMHGARTSTRRTRPAERMMDGEWEWDKTLFGGSARYYSEHDLGERARRGTTSRPRNLPNRDVRSVLSLDGSPAGGCHGLRDARTERCLGSRGYEDAPRRCE
jgi:hypothetical protein